MTKSSYPSSPFDSLHHNHFSINRLFLVNTNSLVFRFPVSLRFLPQHCSRNSFPMRRPIHFFTDKNKNKMKILEHEWEGGRDYLKLTIYM